MRPTRDELFRKWRRGLPEVELRLGDAVSAAFLKQWHSFRLGPGDIVTLGYMVNCTEPDGSVADGFVAGHSFWQLTADYLIEDWMFATRPGLPALYFQARAGWRGKRRYQVTTAARDFLTFTLAPF